MRDDSNYYSGRAMMELALAARAIDPIERDIHRE